VVSSFLTFLALPLQGRIHSPHASHNTSTRKPLAKLQYRIMGRDRLIIQSEEGMGRIEMILITAAKVSILPRSLV
jgi:hypothetical protein